MARDDESAGGAAPDGDDAVAGDVIELTVPAHTGYLGVLRTATAGLAARLGFTLDEIEDLRIAVDEACTMLLSLRGINGATLTCRFRVRDDGLAVTVSAPVGPGVTLPGEQSFTWQVLSAHAAPVSGHTQDGTAAIDMLKRRRP